MRMALNPSLAFWRLPMMPRLPPYPSKKSLLPQRAGATVYFPLAPDRCNSALAIGRRYVLLFRMSGWATPTASATSALRSRFHRLWRFVRFSFTAESTSSNVDKRWLWRRKRRAEALYGSSSQVARSVESSLARLLLRFLNTAFGTDHRHFVGSSRREGPAPPSALLRTTR